MPRQQKRVSRKLMGGYKGQRSVSGKQKKSVSRKQGSVSGKERSVKTEENSG